MCVKVNKFFAVIMSHRWNIYNNLKVNILNYFQVMLSQPIILSLNCFEKSFWKILFWKRVCFTISHSKSSTKPYILSYLFSVHPLSTPWKHQKTIRFSDVFSRLRKGVLGRNARTLLIASQSRVWNIVLKMKDTKFLWSVFS